MGSCCALMAPAAFVQRPMVWLKAIQEYRGEISSAPNFAFDLCVSRGRQRGGSPTRRTDKAVRRRNTTTSHRIYAASVCRALSENFCAMVAVSNTWNTPRVMATGWLRQSVSWPQGSSQRNSTARRKPRSRSNPNSPNTSRVNSVAAIYSLQKFFSCGCGSGKENATATNRYP